MKIHNFLPVLLESLQKWDRPPALPEFTEHYYHPMSRLLNPAFGSAKSLYSVMREVDWHRYRENTLALDPTREEARVLERLKQVEDLFDLKLRGDIVLFGSFETIDGYARFDRGSHCVYLGVDESHGRGRYLDILEVHELTHVARESRPDVWKGWGLDPSMTHDQFSEYQPVIEHVFGEGFSCAISELLVPGEDPWHYVYQDEADFRKIWQNGEAVDLAVHREIEAGENGDWSRLYNMTSYRPRLPVFTHYLWGNEFAKKQIASRGGGDPKLILNRCSKEFLSDARSFRLSESKNYTSHLP